MPSIYDLKPRFQSLLRPLMGRLARLGCTPNAITLLAVAGSLMIGAAVLLSARWPAVLLLLPAWLLARMALNALDGMMARELHMAKGEHIPVPFFCEVRLGAPRVLHGSRHEIIQTLEAAVRELKAS